MNRDFLTDSIVGILAFVFFSTSSSANEFPEPKWKPLFVGVESCEIKIGPAEKPLRGSAVKIDLRAEGLKFTGTADNGATAQETDGQRASSFLTAKKLQLAMNTHYFLPCCNALPGEPKDLNGLAISDGVVVSEAAESMPWHLLISEKNKAAITTIVPDDTDQISVAVAGFLILKDASVVENADVSLHPRTAVGLSKDRRFLFLLVIEGRLSGQQVGADLKTTAEWLIALGAVTGMNLDGGGSTTLVVEDKAEKKGYRFLHRLVMKQERVVGSHLGLWAKKLKP